MPTNPTTSFQTHTIKRTLLILLGSACFLICAFLLYGMFQFPFDSYFGIVASFLVFLCIGAAAVNKHTRLVNSGFSALHTNSAISLGVEAIAEYNVAYLGGLPEYPTASLSRVRAEILSDRFTLLPTPASKSWFSGYVIPFDAVTSVQIVPHQATTAESIFSAGSRHRNNLNNIHISFYDNNGLQLVLRMQMITGLTHTGTAAKCRELEDRLRTAGALEQFYRPERQTPAAPAPAPTAGIPEQIEKLAQLRDKGLITAAEYAGKKSELLARM